jgi:hypothetical protein
MGLRVKRYAPLVTREDVALGLVGFMVVFARQTATMPPTPSPSPTQARATATPIRTAKGTSTGATSEETSHMRTPTSSATIGGGTFSSSQLIATNVGHNVRHERRPKGAAFWASARWRGYAPAVQGWAFAAFADNDCHWPRSAPALAAWAARPTPARPQRAGAARSAGPAMNMSAALTDTLWDLGLNGTVLEHALRRKRSTAQSAQARPRRAPPLAGTRALEPRPRKLSPRSVWGITCSGSHCPFSRSGSRCPFTLSHKRPLCPLCRCAAES